MAAVKVNGKAPAATINFGQRDFYVAGGGIPEGNYALMFDVCMFQAEKKSGEKMGDARLGVKITARNLDDLSADDKEQFYSMGTKAHESFMPNPDTGKSLVAVPDGPGYTNLMQSTNWAIFLASLYDSGLPEGIFINDVSVLDGIHVHLHNVPEPEDRKAFASSATAEVAAEPRKARTIAIVTEIKEDGKPWENTGGWPDKVEKAKANGKTPAKAVAAKAPAKAAAKPAPKAAAPAPATELNEEDMLAMAQELITNHLTKSPDGCPQLTLRLSVHKQAKESAGQEVADSLINGFFGDVDALNSVLEPLGYSTDGRKVGVAA